MEPITPIWFKQRQCRLEAVGENIYKVTGPNLGETYLRIFWDYGIRWRAALRTSLDGPDIQVATDSFTSTRTAWDAGFELYRRAHIV